MQKAVEDQLLLYVRDKNSVSKSWIIQTLKMICIFG